jgi:hypothetical protein
MKKAGEVGLGIIVGANRWREERIVVLVGTRHWGEDWVSIVYI